MAKPRGLEGDNAADVVTSGADNILDGKEWLCVPTQDPNDPVYLYATLSGVPTKVRALGMKTRTPGATFQVSFSNDKLDYKEDFPRLNWTDLPGVYKWKNGRVKVNPFTGKHIRLKITNLRPMVMREYNV